MIWKMALRNLRRNTRRTLITLASIAFGLLLSITFTGVGDSGYTKMIEGAARLGSGNLTVMPKGYLDSPSLDKTLCSAPQMMEEIMRIPYVTAGLERIAGQAMVATAGESTGAAFIAINPEKENPDTLHFLQFIKTGALFDADDRKGIVIGKRMADRLRIKLGSKLVYTTTDKNGEITSDLARVRGIFETGSDQVDSYFILLPLKRVRHVLSYQADEVSQIAVFLKDHRKVPRVIKRLNSSGLFQPYDVLSWRKTMPDMAGFIAMDRSVNYMFQIIIFLLVAAGILNTILMSVLERTREFGIMLAIGISPQRLFGLVLTEAVWLGLFGIIAGLIITSPLYFYLHTHGLDVSGFLHENTDIAGFVFDLTIYNELRFQSLMIILSGAFLITLVAGLYPAYKAGKVVPVESLKQM